MQVAPKTKTAEAIVENLISAVRLRIQGQDVPKAISLHRKSFYTIFSMFRNSSRLLENIPSTNVAMVHSLKFQARTRDIEDFLREFNDLRSLRPALVSGTNAEDKHIQYSTYSVLLSSCECN